MEDINLRLEFHRALDAVAPPAPWLSAHVQEGLRQRRREGWIDRARRRPPIRIQWVLPLVAALLAVAIVATLLLVGHAFQPRTVPVKPPTHQGPAGANCPAWGSIPGGGYPPVSVKMTSATTGWAAGALRTDDGGALWHDVSPPSLRSDEPSLPGQVSVVPPSYAEFFLDSSHAWIARSYSSSTACVDHVNALSTSDGGLTWQMSAPVLVSIQPGAALQVFLDFIDPQNGWLQVNSSLYGTVSGGRDWRLISNSSPTCSAWTTAPWAKLTFASATTAWSSCPAYAVRGGASAAMPDIEPSVTHDGGVTWTPQRLPDPPGGCPCSIDSTVFFDQSRGVVQVVGYSRDSLLATSDGGNTWHVLPPPPPGNFAFIDFADADHLWLLEAPPTSGKGGPDSLYLSTNGGTSWTLVQRDTPTDGALVTTLQFVDANDGFVLQQGGDGSPRLLVTTDGGHSWTVIQPQVS